MHKRPFKRPKGVERINAASVDAILGQARARVHNMSFTFRNTVPIPQDGPDKGESWKESWMEEYRNLQEREGLATKLKIKQEKLRNSVRVSFTRQQQLEENSNDKVESRVPEASLRDEDMERGFEAERPTTSGLCSVLLTCFSCIFCCFQCALSETGVVFRKMYEDPTGLNNKGHNHKYKDCMAMKAVPFVVLSLCTLATLAVIAEIGADNVNELHARAPASTNEIPELQENTRVGQQELASAENLVNSTPGMLLPNGMSMLIPNRTPMPMPNGIPTDMNLNVPWNMPQAGSTPVSTPSQIFSSTHKEGAPGLAITYDAQTLTSMLKTDFKPSTTHSVTNLIHNLMLSESPPPMAIPMYEVVPSVVPPPQRQTPRKLLARFMEHPNGVSQHRRKGNN